MPERLGERFFARDARKVARDLLGKILVVRFKGRFLRSRIVEAESYFGEDDPGSRASRGKNKISEMMWESPGTVMIYNVHKYLMLNFITGREGIPQGVLIRALESLNFRGRLRGPGLLTENLGINRRFHGKKVYRINGMRVEEPRRSERTKIEIASSNRIGLTQDLEEELRFYIRGNKFVSGSKKHNERI